MKYFENTGDKARPVFARRGYLKAGRKVIRRMAGKNGSVQGPAGAKWGYSNPSVADWDLDGKLDILVNDIWGDIVWYRNTGVPGAPELAAARPVEIEWRGAPPKPDWVWWQPAPKQLVTSTWNRDGAPDLVMLNHQGYLSLYRRSRENGVLRLHPPERIFVEPSGRFRNLSRWTRGAQRTAQNRTGRPRQRRLPPGSPATTRRRTWPTGTATAAPTLSSAPRTASSISTTAGSLRRLRPAGIRTALPSALWPGPCETGPPGNGCIPASGFGISVDTKIVDEQTYCRQPQQMFAAVAVFSAFLFSSAPSEIPDGTFWVYTRKPDNGGRVEKAVYQARRMVRDYYVTLLRRAPSQAELDRRVADHLAVPPRYDSLGLIMQLYDSPESSTLSTA